MKTGLLLEGGAMRGMYTAGVLDVFMKYGIDTDMIVGVSAGALFGVNLLSGQAGRAIRYNKKYNGNKNYLGILPLLKERNIVSTKWAYEKVPRELDIFDDETFRDRTAKIPFYAVATDCEDGKPVYFKIDSVFEQMDMLRASGSMPFVSTPVEIDGGLYLDGGISDSIPCKWLARQGISKMIAVLTQSEGYVKRPMPHLLTNLYLGKFPYVARALANRHKRYNASLEQLAKWESEGRAFVLRPSEPLKISKIEKDPDKLQAVYDLGIKDAEARIEELIEFCRTAPKRPSADN